MRVVPAAGDAGTSAVGTLTFIDNGVDAATGTVTLKAQFANADRALWPGQFVRVALNLFEQANAVLVPTQAVLSSQDGSFVFVIDSAGKATVRPVVAGRAVGTRTLIESGLDAGERVVTDGQAKLSPGAKVEIKATAAVRASGGASTGASR